LPQVLGGVNMFLVGEIVDALKRGDSARDVLKAIRHSDPSEAETLVVRLWRKVVFESELAKRLAAE
jgi:hypothetical protein